MLVPITAALEVSSHPPTVAAHRLLDVLLYSFERLEVAVALHRAATQGLSLSELETRLPLPRELVARGLDELARAGAVKVDGGVARLTLDPQVIPAMEEIAALHEDDPLLVVRTLTEISVDKIRGMAARTFVDAFHLSKHQKDHDEEG